MLGYLGNIYVLLALAVITLMDYNDYHRLPRSVVHLAKKLDKRGYDIVERDDMSSSEIKGLASIISGDVKKLRDKAADTSQALSKSLGAANEIINYVDTMRKEVEAAVAELQAALGQHTNMPPLDK